MLHILKSCSHQHNNTQTVIWEKAYVLSCTPLHIDFMHLEHETALNQYHVLPIQH